MCTVYILKNSLTGKHYIGSTNDLVRRVAEHNRGHTRSTRQKGQWEVIYTEQYDELLPARRRERQIKIIQRWKRPKEVINAGLV